MPSGRIAAQKLMDECGIESTDDLPLEVLVAARGATLIQKPMNKADGRIVMTKSRNIITINSDIQYEGKRRFTLAHELGHLEMHKDKILQHNDSDATLQYFKTGNQESEANDFASELLMPRNLFIKECQDKPFSPSLLRDLSLKFKTSITSVTYKYLELGPHPICLFYCHNNKVNYWKRKEDFPHFINDRTKLPPPSDSVASEWFDQGTIYAKNESQQEIVKSTWFTLNENSESDDDYSFWEYCIVTKDFNTTLSVVWED
jgi:Zn-dependent peptidase ImmA (M78 family)